MCFLAYTIYVNLKINFVLLYRSLISWSKKFSNLSNQLVEAKKSNQSKQQPTQNHINSDNLRKKIKPIYAATYAKPYQL
jgi:hypothetical protein